MVKRKQKFGLDMFKKKVKNAEAGNVENADNQEIMTEVEQTEYILIILFSDAQNRFCQDVSLF